MIIETARLVVDPVRADEYEAAALAASEFIVSTDGYLGHEFFRSEAEPGVYLLVVRWRSKADHVAGFRGSEAYERWRDLLHPFYDPVPDVDYWEPIT